MSDTLLAPSSPLACPHCALRELCLPVGLDLLDLAEADGLKGATRYAVPRGAALFRAGDAFESVLAVNTGFFKTRQIGAQGDERITGFHMAGELLGLEGLASDRHVVDAIALEDSQVCVVPYAQWVQHLRERPGLQLQFHRLLGQEVVRGLSARTSDHVRADTRVAGFLLDLAARLRVRGYSGTELVLRMSRAEIGSFLGITLETVSRALSTFQSRQWLDVRQRHVRIREPEALARLVASESAC